MKKIAKQKLPFLNKKEHLLVEHFVNAARNSELENLHCGISPSSAIGDFSDVKVVSPYGAIDWVDLSRISDEEMGALKDSFREQMVLLLRLLKMNGLVISAKKGSIMNSVFYNYQVKIPDKWQRQTEVV